MGHLRVVEPHHAMSSTHVPGHTANGAQQCSSTDGAEVCVVAIGSYAASLKQYLSSVVIHVASEPITGESVRRDVGSVDHRLRFVVTVTLWQTADDIASVVSALVTSFGVGVLRMLMVVTFVSPGDDTDEVRCKVHDALAEVVKTNTKHPSVRACVPVLGFELDHRGYTSNPFEISKALHILGRLPAVSARSLVLSERLLQSHVMHERTATKVCDTDPVEERALVVMSEGREWVPWKDLQILEAENDESGMEEEEEENAFMCTEEGCITTAVLRGVAAKKITVTRWCPACCDDTEWKVFKKHNMAAEGGVIFVCEEEGCGAKAYLHGARAKKQSITRWCQSCCMETGWQAVDQQ